MTGFGFVNYDDDRYVFRNPILQAGLSKTAIWWALTTFFYSNWHPLTWISYLVDHQVHGLDPGWCHFTNLLLHTANTVLLFWTLDRLTRATWRSAFVAALFALHPMHVESVAWVSERKGVLSTFFWMLATWAYVAYVRSSGSWRRYTLVVLAFLLGLMAKPMLVTLPFVLLLLDYWPLRRWRGTPGEGSSRPSSAWFSLIREKVPLFLMAAVSSAITLAAQQQGGAVQSLAKLSLSQRVANAWTAYVSYMVKMVWPRDLAVLYPYDPHLPASHVAGAAALLAGITVFVVRKREQCAYLAVGWFWYVGTLVPVIGLLQVGAQAMADRYSYVPLIGLFIMLVWGFSDLAARWSIQRPAALGAAGVLLPILGIHSWYQANLWRDSIPLFEHALRVTANNSVIHNNLGYTLAAQGRDDEAIPHYREALRIDPNYADAMVNLGVALIRQNRFEEAFAQSTRALELKPDSGMAHNSLGILFSHRGEMESAIAHLSQAVRLDPNDADANNNLGFALSRQGRFAEAIPYFSQALRVQPDLETARTNLEHARSALHRTPR